MLLSNREAFFGLYQSNSGYDRHNLLHESSKTGNASKNSKEKLYKLYERSSWDKVFKKTVKAFVMRLETFVLNDKFI